MGRPRRVRPLTDTLTISDGDTLIVKRELTYGEETEYKALYIEAQISDEQSENGKLKVQRRFNKVVMPIAKAAAYLVGWSLCDEDGPISLPEDLPGKLAVINSLDADTVEEIIAAVDAHEEAREAAKKSTTATPATA